MATAAIRPANASLSAGSSTPVSRWPRIALQSIVAAVLGGASLAGGRGSFVGAVLAALFLSLILNVMPLLQQPTEYAQIAIGALTLLALLVYQGPELLARARASHAAAREARSARTATRAVGEG